MQIYGLGDGLRKGTLTIYWHNEARKVIEHCVILSVTTVPASFFTVTCIMLIAQTICNRFSRPE